jgi:methylamine utilization protein MauJ
VRSWWIVGLDTCISWPPKVGGVSFGGHPIVFPELEDGCVPTIAVAYNMAALADPPFGYGDHLGEPRCSDEDEAIRLGRRFLSALAWTHREAVSADFEFGSGQLMAASRMRARGRVLGPGPDLSYLPDPKDEEGRLALAYHREALGLASVFYQFLSLWKILELRFGEDGQLKQWIDAAVPTLEHPHAVQRIQGIRVRRMVSIGARLYATGRCTVAHARKRGHRVDPDDPGHLRRVRADLPLMRALAERFIEIELGILSAGAEARRRESLPLSRFQPDEKTVTSSEAGS